MVFVKTNPFREDLPQYSRSVLVPLPRPTDDGRLIVQAAMAGLRALYRPGFAFQKCGVMLTDLCDRSNEQLDLMATPLADAERQRNERLMGHSGQAEQGAWPRHGDDRHGQEGCRVALAQPVAYAALHHAMG